MVRRYMHVHTCICVRVCALSLSLTHTHCKTTFPFIEFISIVLYNYLCDYLLNVYFPPPNYSLHEDKDNVLFSTVSPVTRVPMTVVNKYIKKINKLNI